MAKVEHFDSTAVALHWATAALIVVAFGLGLAVDAFPKDWEHAVVNTHSLLGIAIIALTAARIAWRLGHAPPPLPEEFGGPLVRRAAAVVHFLLYTLMVVVPLIGLAAAHMLAALYHHFIRRDEVLLQMLTPARR